MVLTGSLLSPCLPSLHPFSSHLPWCRGSAGKPPGTYLAFRMFTALASSFYSLNVWYVRRIFTALVSSCYSLNVWSVCRMFTTLWSSCYSLNVCSSSRATTPYPLTYDLAYFSSHAGKKSHVFRGCFDGIHCGLWCWITSDSLPKLSTQHPACSWCLEQCLVECLWTTEHSGGFRFASISLLLAFLIRLFLFLPLTVNFNSM